MTLMLKISSPAFALALLTSSLPAQASGLRKLRTATTGLGALATAKQIQFGYAVQPKSGTNGVAPGCTTAYCERVAHDSNIIGAENAFKMNSIMIAATGLSPSEWTFNWTNADKIIDFAKERGLALRGHALFYENSLAKPFIWNPGLSNVPDIKRAQMRQMMYDYAYVVFSHIEARYPGAMKEWDVANESYQVQCQDYEACHLPALIEHGPFWSIFGDDWLVTAFQAADAARHAINRPDIILTYNDFVETRSICDSLATQIAKGAPIDAVGLQTHLPPYGTADGFEAGYVSTFAHCAAKGLRTRVTEYDRPARPPLESWETAEEHKSQSELNVYATQQARVQGEVLSAVLRACLNPASNCNQFIIWGVTDRQSVLNRWGFCKLKTTYEVINVPDSGRGIWSGDDSRLVPGSCRQLEGWGLIFDDTLAEKPAYAMVREALESQGGTPPPTNQAPTVSWRVPPPANGVAPLTFTLEAQASDPEGGLVKVELLQNSVVQQTKSAGPFIFPVGALAAGNYEFQLRVFDAEGLSSISTKISTAVSDAPTNGLAAFYVKSAGSNGFCADVYGISRVTGASVNLWGCNGGVNQRMIFSAADGQFGPIQVYDNLTCLDSDSAGRVYLNRCDANLGSQSFVYNAVTQTIANSSGKCLDVYGAAYKNGTRLYMWGCHGGANQKWIRAKP